MTAYRCDGLFWFRIFGYGLHIKDMTKHPPLFSERNGNRKHLRIGKWSIGILKRGDA